ncbi:DUF1097 family protein [Clostridium estertheticum]|uniref:DUF1097 family protein n=1 Tax=Clostridium estertheticum TaxID=238834 RepID=UPI00227C2027|nr:DUF1097 family protein [Clostridium estertheticum]WAG68011.1 DUF1097 family protein [Clostridium estertheticum]
MPYSAGAKRSEYINYSVSAVMGVIWGLIYVYVIAQVGETWPPININMLITTGILTFICCAFHFCVTGKMYINQVAMVFGGISSTLLQGGTKIPAIMITLVLGVTLALICQKGTKLLSENGKWRFFFQKTRLLKTLKEKL